MSVQPNQEPNNIVELGQNNTEQYWCIAARYHVGDENGISKVKFSVLELPEMYRKKGYKILLDDFRIVSVSESGRKGVNNVFECQSGEVVTARRHIGDENAMTDYTVATVKILVETENEETKILQCFTQNIDLIHTKRESKANWVEAVGKVIVARTHTGDENGKTDTKFGHIYFKDLTGETVRLLADRTEESDKISESKSNFFKTLPNWTDIFTAAAGTVFTEQSLPASLLPDHTWVDPNVTLSDGTSDIFVCFGGHGNANKVILGNFPVPADAYEKIVTIRGKNDSIGITYFIQGVCHQASNRFLLPSAREIRTVCRRPRGYGLSVCVYGFMGFGYKKWRRNKYDPLFGNTQLANLNDNRIDFDEDEETTYIIECSTQMLNELFPAKTYSISDAQRTMMQKRTAILKKYNFITDDNCYSFGSPLDEEKITAAVNELNKAIKELQVDIRKQLGNTDFETFNCCEGDLDELINLEVALDFFKEI